MFEYQQHTGDFYRNNQLVAVGYSGNGAGLNNPAYQSRVGVGPIPCGKWVIGSAIDHPRLGPCVFHLTPAPGTNTFGRSALFIHGDNKQLDHSASDGCIVLDRDTRWLIRDSGDTGLVVST